MSARNKIDWDSVLSPFRHYEYGLVHGNELYPSPMHVLAVLLHGDTLYRQLSVLDNYDAQFIAKLLFGMRADSTLHALYAKHFPQNARPLDHAAYLARLVAEQYPASEVLANRAFDDEMARFCAPSKPLVEFCECFRASFLCK